MFAVLQIEPYARRFAERFRREKPARIERVLVKGGASFFLVRVPCCGAGSVKRLQRDAPDLPLLLPNGVQAGEGLRLFHPQRLPLLCAAMTASEHIRQTHRPVRQNALGVLDPDGVLCGKTACLLPAAGDVRIVTDRPQRFARDVRDAMRSFGAPLTVGSDPALLCGCGVLLCGSSANLPEGVHAQTVYCLGDEMRGGFDETIVLSDLRIPPPYDALCPPDVDPLLFAAALYELCGVGAMERCRFWMAK